MACWGRNNERQIAAVTPIYRGAPTDRMDLGGAVLKATGGLNHACALLEDQTVRCWGDNTFGKVSALAGSPVTSPMEPERTRCLASWQSG